MKKMRMSFAELIKKNKDELLKDRAQLEKIEKRIDDKHVKAKN
ncbi:FbpB family small basic protein [Bacillus sp. M6-12]|nr:FbpB family small basic protein [Bacillus sp. M6-12]